MQDRKPEPATDFATWRLPEGAIARLGRGEAGGAAFSPDEKYLAVSTRWTGMMWLYELPTLSPVAFWEESGSLTFSPDSRQLLVSNGNGLRIWDVQQHACITALENVHGSTPVFSPDGHQIVTADDTKIYVWCTQTGRQIRETELRETGLTRPGNVFSPDIKFLARQNYDIERGRDKSFSVFDVATGEQLVCITEVPKWAQFFSFSPCGKFLAVGGLSGSLDVWEWQSARLHLATEYGDGPVLPYYPPTGELLVAARCQRITEVWNGTEKLDTFECHGNKGTPVCFSESGAFLLASESSGEFYVWEKGDANAHTLCTLDGYLRTVDSLAFSADSKTLAAAIWGGNILLWDVASRHSQQPEVAIGGADQVVHPTASGKILATSRDSENVKIWELGNSEPIAEFVEPDTGFRKSRTRKLRYEALSPTGQQFALCDCQGDFHVWDWASHKMLKHTLFTGPGRDDVSYALAWRGTGPRPTVKSGRDDVSYALAFSPDGKRLAGIACEWTGRLWAINARTEIAELSFTLPSKPGVLGIAFSPRGDIIAGAQRGEIVLWDATNGKTLMSLPQPKENQNPVALCFSPCGRYFASGSWWQRGLKQMPIRLWEVATGENIATFHGHTTDVQCIAFSPDGTLMATGGHDGIILLWDVRNYMGA